jgi:hypothetical protein
MEITKNCTFRHESYRRPSFTASLMSKPLPNLSPGQLKTFETLARIKMAWLALGVVLCLFTIGFLSFIYAVFFVPEYQTVTAVIHGGIDGLLGWGLRIVLNNLFPKK